MINSRALKPPAYTQQICEKHTLHANFLFEFIIYC